MIKKDDKLKRILSGQQVSFGPQEIDMWSKISLAANIKIVWVGWGGWNAVNGMVRDGIEWVEFWAINTDSQALYNSLADNKIVIWKAVTGWLWAWANPEMWKKAAEETSEEIKRALDWADMVFITCWLWGWTWTWAAPVVAEIAKWLWALTVWVVTKPFSFEWQSRWGKALDWYNALKEKVDALITIPNDRILNIIDKKTPLLDAFAIVDDVLKEWVLWITDIVTENWTINADFNDVKSIMKNSWSALMWIWYWSGENRAVERARAAIDSPLLELSIAWAKWILFNITGGTDLSMFEVDEAAKIITESRDPNANIIFATTINENYTWELKITVIATWFDEETNKSYSSWYQTQKQSPFWRKNIGEQKPISNQVKPVEKQDDLDVPAFLRKKI